MPCQSCAERRKAMKEFTEKKLAAAKHWAAVRIGLIPNGQAIDTAAKAGNGTGQASATEGGRSPTDQSPQHEQRSVEADKGARAGKGRLPMQGVRKARSGQARPR